MAHTERIRKQVYELTAQDLIDHPLWEFCSDEEGEEGQDEATVKPSEDREVPGYSPGAYICSCDVTFADGSNSIGYIYSGEAEDFGCVQPNLIHDMGQINFWIGWLHFVKEPEQIAKRAFAHLNKSPELTFPIRFETRPKINGATMKVTVDGFMAKGADQKLTDKTFVAIAL